MATIVIDGARREVVVARSKDGFVVTVGAHRYDVRDVVRIDDGLAFLLDHESHVARVATGRGGVEISLGGRTYVQTRETMDSDRPASGHGRGGDGRMEAPMPGSIIAVNVKEGDHVRSGQPLIVLESMKMHNEIASPLDGVVRKVNCKVGDQVAFGHVLVEIGAEAS
jgi:3-methylcrotonyl-CoA carboxylase alpha subunit